jgi:hypothetical protein
VRNSTELIDLGGSMARLKLAGTWRVGLIVGATLATSMGLGIGVAGAGTTDAPGTITCTKVSGTISFKPALTWKTNSVKARAAISLKLADCTTTKKKRSPNPGRGVTEPRSAISGTSKSNISFPGYWPPPIFDSAKAVFKTTWSKNGIAPTVTSFSGFSVYVYGSTVTFAFPETGGTATGTGSYAGSDHGKSSTLTLIAKAPTGSKPINTLTITETGSTSSY